MDTEVRLSSILTTEMPECKMVGIKTELQLITTYNKQELHEGRELCFYLLLSFPNLFTVRLHLKNWLLALSLYSETHQSTAPLMHTQLPISFTQPCLLKMNGQQMETRKKQNHPKTKNKSKQFGGNRDCRHRRNRNEINEQIKNSVIHVLIDKTSCDNVSTTGCWKKRGEEEKHRKWVLKREEVGEAGEGEWNGVE